MADKDGPSTLEYVDTRMDLLAASTEKMQVAIDQRFTHMEELTALISENAKRAIDKAETAQHAHNVAANEWRDTLNDFKATLISRAEFDRLYVEFASYKLETARIIAATGSATLAKKEERAETKDDSKWLITTIIALIVAALSVGVMVFSRPTVQTPTPSVIYVPAPVGSLIPSQGSPSK